MLQPTQRLQEHSRFPAVLIPAAQIAACINQQPGMAGRRTRMGRGILLWFLGVPIPLILIILLFWH
ncbi:hypothetical protein F2982_05000 [Rhizobium sp. BG4]|nr:hypothetical protein F2982_05000 [Rhizobium sp. BG4]